MFYFYAPWKRNLWFSDIFRGYRNGTLAKWIHQHETEITEKNSFVFCGTFQLNKFFLSSFTT